MRSSASSRPRSRSGYLLASVVGLALLGAALVGCGGAATAAPPDATLGVTDAWVRPPVGPDRPAAGYVTITNPGGTADALVGASSPIAMSVEIHETTMDSSGMAGMHPIPRLEVAAGGTVKLEPGGYHMMLMGTGDKLKIGDTVEITLQFEHAGTVVVKAEVRAG
ncbi:MAG: copper chaperone PCu(A)C [Candidatus Limnocylindrales bacterium]